MSEIKKIALKNFENISKVSGIDMSKINKFIQSAVSYIWFIPNEFSGPLGAEWIEDPTNDGTYEVTGGQLVTTQSGGQFAIVYQTFEDPFFDIWTKFSVTNTGLSGVYNRYNVGNFAIWSPPYEDWNYPTVDLYLQYNYGTATEYSLAIYVQEEMETGFREDPYIPDGFDIYNPEIYLRIKYTVGDFVRIYWSQGGEWVEIDTGVNIIPSQSKHVILQGFGSISPVNNTVSFDFIRKHNEIPFVPE